MSRLARALRVLFSAPPQPAQPSRPPPPVRRRLTARYDAAESSDENRRHWANADDLSANGANSSSVRATLRKRARYECANNSYLNGLVKTIAQDMIGTGPRLQLNLGDEFLDSARQIERDFAAWCRAVNLADKLRVMSESKIRDGEAFGILTTNPLIRHPVKLDIRLIEAEQVCTPNLAWSDPAAVDGIVFDRWGNPKEYHVLKQHPGDNWLGLGPMEYDPIPADEVLHWFRPDRPGQARGVPEITPALPLGAQLRRYTLAVITAAEWAACVAGMLESELPVDAETGYVTEERLFDTIEAVRGMLLTLPPGTKATQFAAEQPTGTYKEFKGEILNEMGRCVNAPFNVVAGNSSGYNYSSGRLDHLPYHRSLWIEREGCRFRAIDRLFRTWLAEYLLVPAAEGGAPQGLPDLELWQWDWHWDGFASIDPQKDASATESRLKLHLTTLAEECAAEGKDWREVLQQRAAEKAEMKRLGLTPPPAAMPAAEPEDEEESANA